MMLKNKGLIKNDYWLCPPAHLSYFDNKSLKGTLESCGYSVTDILGGFPIELFLLNEKSSYNLNKELGPYAHKVRVEFDVSLFKNSIENYVTFRRGCGESGVCRDLIAYCKVR